MFSKNLQYLRKRDKITQEELADKLGVSRQSVSKWETGDAYPETDKLILLCDMFCVSLDELMRGDLTDRADGAEPCPEYSAHMDGFSRNISVGIFLVIFGVAVCLALCGYSEVLPQKTADIVSVMGGVSVVLFVVPAVFLFVFSGLKHDAFCKEHPEIGGVFGENEVKAYKKRFAVTMPCLVSGILIDAVVLIVFSSLIDAGAISTDNEDAAYCYVVSAFLAALAFLIGGIVYAGMQFSKYDVSEYNKQNSKDKSPRSKLKDGLCGAVMLTATALFLVLGFVWGWWHPAWVAFPVGGIICGIISSVIDALNR